MVQRVKPKMAQEICKQNYIVKTQIQKLALFIPAIADPRDQK